MEIPAITVTQSLENGEYLSTICGGEYHGYHSDKTSAVAIAVLSYISVNYSVVQLVIDGDCTSVEELLQGFDLDCLTSWRESKIDESKIPLPELDLEEIDWEGYKYQALIRETGMCAYGVDPLSAIAKFMLVWLKTNCGLKALEIDGVQVQIDNGNYLFNLFSEDNSTPNLNADLLASLSSSRGSKSNDVYVAIGEIKFECRITVRPGQCVHDKVNSLLLAMNGSASAQLHLTDDDNNLTVINLAIVEADTQDVGQL